MAKAIGEGVRSITTPSVASISHEPIQDILDDVFRPLRRSHVHQLKSASRAPTTSRKMPKARCTTSGGSDVPSRAPK